jgi:tRNA threonylcarbamoyladenosine biosynthesis protein TsaE
MIHIVKSLTETRHIAHELAATLRGGEILCLFGELGSGKTTFTAGLAEALGITSEITSPTFTLMNLYSAQTDTLQTLVHIDTYRLEDEKELVDIGAEDYIGQRTSITVIEWPEKITSLLNDKKIIKIKFEHLENNHRKIEINQD